VCSVPQECFAAIQKARCSMRIHVGTRVDFPDNPELRGYEMEIVYVKLEGPVIQEPFLLIDPERPRCWLFICYAGAS
jgi:hypothetical protein